MTEVDRITRIKIEVARKKGYAGYVQGTEWEFAMILTHRTKRQIALYEEVLRELEKELLNNKQ
ncbi:MAG: hypothetical protein HOO91_17755 [Bacteroidales bacterium]|nr:hypothetical protein [Bacteroidales bacterium]